MKTEPPPLRGGDAAEGGEGVAHTDFMRKADSLFNRVRLQRKFQQRDRNRKDQGAEKHSK